MKYSLKNYQREAVDDLKRYFNFYYPQKDKMIAFKAPTGSGKTFMLSSMIDEIVNESENKDFCFVWASIGKGELQIQSFDAVSAYLGGYPKCSLLDNEFFGSRSYIKKFEVVFVNWEKLVQKDSTTGKWKNCIMKDQEGASFIKVIAETKKRGTKIILVIDESHIGKSQEGRILEFKNTILEPDITIEMSATPLTKPDVSVDPEKVIDEGMIKESIIVNEGIHEKLIVNDDITSEELVLEFGYNKRLSLIEDYREIGSEVNPLVLVQIPNMEQGDQKIIVIQDFLRNRGITLENGKLKFWLTGKEHDFDKKKIKEINDPTEFLVFKTAVATGWDCPRAHVLVKFREGNSETFEIQTIGRILRTAEAKSYGNSKLDNAYIFTNLSKFETKKESYNPNAIKTEMSHFRTDSKKQSIYTPIYFKSYYRSRQNDYNSADSGFYTVFEDEFCTFFGIVKGSIDYSNPDKIIEKGFVDSSKVGDLVIRETEIGVLGIDEEQSSHSGTKDVTASDSDILFAFYDLIKQNLNGLAYVRSKSPVNGAIIESFAKYYHQFPRAERIMAIQKLVVQNKDMFSEILSKATARYRDMLIQNAGKTGVFLDFEIQQNKSYSRETYKEETSTLALYQPFRMLITDHEKNKVNQLELAFLKYLDRHEQLIDWHWQNGSEVMEINFGIPYNNGVSTFQPDFIVRFKNGTIGIFDTKPIAERVDDTKIKAEALYQYIKEANLTRDPALGTLIGGIVVSNKTDYSQFYYYNEIEYVDFSVSQTNWHMFNEIFRCMRT
jgi:type III restriction enzyme